jgi:hypothetical protein
LLCLNGHPIVTMVQPESCAFIPRKYPNGISDLASLTHRHMTSQVDATARHTPDIDEATVTIGNVLTAVDCDHR